MESDCFFTIGKGHRECQDYARSSSGFIVVGDGCSSSRDTDVGVRHIVNSAMLRHRRYGTSFDPGWVIRRAAKAAAMLGNCSTSLDATLLVATLDERSGIHCFAAGDGYIAARMRSGELRLWEIDDGPAPAYLSYTIDSERLQRYWDEWGIRRRITASVDGEVVSEQFVSLRDDYVFHLRLSTREVETVFLMSDGVNSFQDGAGEKVDVRSVVDELCALKSVRGEFVRRRARRFLGKTCSRRSWGHDDDLAIAALHIPGGQRENMA